MVSDRNAETTIAGLRSCPTVFSAVPTGRYAGFSRETKPKLHQTLLFHCWFNQSTHIIG